MAQAFCEDCDWRSLRSNVVSEAIKSSNRHEKDTNHTVNLESGPEIESDTNQLDKAEQKTEGNLFKLSGWVEPEEERKNSIVESVYISTKIERDELVRHIESFKDAVPRGQRRTVWRLIHFLRTNGVEVSPLNKEGYFSIT